MLDMSSSRAAKVARPFTGRYDRFRRCRYRPRPVLHWREAGWYYNCGKQEYDGLSNPGPSSGRGPLRLVWLLLGALPAVAVAAP